MENKQRLDEFSVDNEPDGHYVIWVSEQIPHKGSFLYGFSSAVVYFCNREGFSDTPEWLDKCEDNEVNILLLEEMPNLTQ